MPAPAERARLPSARAVLALAATLIVFWPVVHCFFHDDDFVHLYFGVNASWRELALVHWGGHLLAVFSLLVAGLLAVVGPWAEAFYLLMLASHLVAVWLLFVLVRRLTGDVRAAGIAALLWGTTPAHTETLAWFSAYQMVMPTVTTELAILMALDRPGRGGAVLVALLLLAGALTHGVGMAAALVFPFVVWCLVPPGPARRRLLAATALVAIAVPVIYQLAVKGGGVSGLGQAYLPHLRVVALAVARNVFWLLVNGVTRLHAGAYAGASKLSTELLAITCVGWAVLVGVGLLRMSGADRRRVLAFGLLALAVYGSIALGRSVTLAIFGITDMGSIRRYHYTATLPLALVTGLALHAALSRVRERVRHVALDVLFAAAFLTAVVRSGATAAAIVQHPAARAETARVMATIAETARQVPPGTVVRVPNQRFGPAGGVIHAGFPGWAAVFAIWSRSNDVDGRPIVFVDPDPVTVEVAARGRRSAALLVGPAVQ